jgi:hypothetical protein
MKHKRLDAIEKMASAQSAARIARAIETGDYSALTETELDSELIWRAGEKFRTLTPEQWGRGKAYTPTEQELVALQARKFCDVSEDCLFWDIVRATENVKLDQAA